MLTRKVNGETVVISSEEEQEIRAEWEANRIASEAKTIEEKRKRLIAITKEEAIEALITAELAGINNMNETALDAALAAKGIT